jgi:hypothetical protein
VTQIKQITIPSDNRGAGRCGLRKRRATRFLTNINRTTVIATTMKINLQQEDAMGAKSKSGIVRGAGRKRASNAPGKPGRGAGNKPEAWEQTARVPDDRDDEIDCQRIVQGDGGRSLPRYFDDYN